MGFHMVAFPILSDGVKASVKALLEHHKLDPNRENDSIKKLDTVRRIHAQLLLKVVDVLKDSILSDQEKAKILNGAVYFIRDQINASYKYSYPERSHFFNSLTTALKLDKENIPSREDKIGMYFCFSQFLLGNVYALGDPSKGRLLEIHQHFSPEKIKGYNVVEEIRVLKTKIYEMELEQLDEAEKKNAQEVAEKKSGGQSKGMAAFFVGSSPAAAAPSTGLAYK